MFRLKQEALAEMLGVSQATVSRWEHGKDRPLVSDELRFRTILDAMNKPPLVPSAPPRAAASPAAMPAEMLSIKAMLRLHRGPAALMNADGVIIDASPVQRRDFERRGMSAIGFNPKSRFTENLRKFHDEWGREIFTPGSPLLGAEFYDTGVVMEGVLMHRTMTAIEVDGERYMMSSDNIGDEVLDSPPPMNIRLLTKDDLD